MRKLVTSGVPDFTYSFVFLVSIDFNDETYGETHGTFVAEVNTYGAAKLWVVNVVLRSQSPSTWRLSEAPLE